MSKQGKLDCVRCGGLLNAKPKNMRKKKKKDVSNVYHFRQSARGCSALDDTDLAASEQKPTMQRCHGDDHRVYCHYRLFFTHSWHPSSRHCGDDSTDAHTFDKVCERLDIANNWHTSNCALEFGVWQLENDTARCCVRVCYKSELMTAQNGVRSLLIPKNAMESAHARLIIVMKCEKRAGLRFIRPQRSITVQYGRRRSLISYVDFVP